ncbi:5816_t:CDS:2 [Funneliformis geosporum]|uniref:10868_t:CDS:1 n=1 Tax=Funneliformis geosporum TaxID=1117311 RepID=A0A9W4SQR6_9GLOM|nr:10868_t:CDS:2 [Funneliformis geosporum]CAI2191619.1 5816_t:CDS:2 [Funneliformis geosporum]
MNFDNDEFDDLCKGFETQKNLNKSKKNSMEIDKEVKLDEIAQVMDDSLEIFKLSEFEEVFLFSYFDLSPAVLIDFASRQNLNSISQKSEIKEILLINIRIRSKEPYLVTRISIKDIIIYKTYQYISSSDVFDPFQKSQSQAKLSEHLA